MATQISILLWQRSKELHRICNPFLQQINHKISKYNLEMFSLNPYTQDTRSSIRKKKQEA